MTSVPDVETSLSVGGHTDTRPAPWWRHSFTLLVALPTLLTLAYLLLFASSQYRVEAQFVIRGVDSQPPALGGVGQLLGVTQKLGTGMQEARSVREYLLSAEAIRALKVRKIDLIEFYRRPEADIFSRLWYDHPRVETLLDYYRDHVELTYDPDDNITRMQVRTFRPEDSRALAAALLAIGEQQVNALNDRLFAASIKAGDEQMRRSEQELASISTDLAQFRRANRDLDPTVTGESGLKALTEQQARLDGQEAILGRMQRDLDPSSPQLQAMRSRVEAMRSAIGASRSRLTGFEGAVSDRLRSYEELMLRRDFAAKQYEAARAAVQKAREKATEERLFVIPVVSPTTPEKPYLPKPMWTSFSVFVALAVCYGIGWMMVAGIRERRG